MNGNNFIEKCCPVCGKYYLDRSKNGAKVACSPACRYEWYNEVRPKDQILERRIYMRLKVFEQKGIIFSESDIKRMTEKLLEGVCEVCGNAVPLRRLHIDHDHETNKFRGILCDNCNHALGLAFDDLNILNGLIKYLSNAC